MNRNRVVITGMGPVCSLGLGRKALRAGLARTGPGCGPISLFEPAPGLPQAAAEVPPFDIDDYLVSRKTYLDRASELALASASLALDDAGLGREPPPGDRTGLCLGSAWGCADTLALFHEDLHAKGPRLVKPMLFQHTYPNTPISLLAIEYGLTGHHSQHVSGRLASVCALAEAYDLIRSGRLDLALAGGFEALSEARLAAQTAAGRLSPRGRCEPFEDTADGTVLGEGAAVLILESMRHARARRARPLCEIAGLELAAGASADLAATIARVLHAAGLPRLAHRNKRMALFAAAGGEADLDEAESAALAATGIRNANMIHTPKARLGETEGAAAALHACAAAAAPRENGPGHGSVALVVAADPGGTAACLVLGAPENDP